MLPKRKKSESEQKKDKKKTTTNGSSKTTTAAILEDFAELLPAGGLKKLKKQHINGGASDQLLNVGNFKAFPVHISPQSDELKYLFLKKLQASDSSDFSVPEDFAEERTLVVANLVADATEEDVRTIFSCKGGTVTRIKFIDLPEFSSQQRVCLVEFEDSFSIDQLFSLKKSEAVKLALSEKGFVRGMEKWLAEFKLARPDPEVLQKQVDEFMLEYDKREEQRRREREKLASQPDADGFVPVVRRGRKMASDGKVSVQAVRASDVKVTQAETVSDFYRFQRRDAKREQLETLQKRFEEDKQRIAKMKQNRKFKPY